MEKIVLRFNAIVFVAYGIMFALVPEAMSRWIVGSSPSTTSGLIDMRSTYGGMSFAIGLLLWSMAGAPQLQLFGLRAVSIVMGSMAAARLVGFFVDGSPSWMMWAYLAVEIFTLCLSAWLSLRLSASSGETDVRAA